jgi:hypothetical protein
MVALKGTLSKPAILERTLVSKGKFIVVKTCLPDLKTS